MVLHDNNDLFPQYNRKKIFPPTKITVWTRKKTVWYLGTNEKLSGIHKFS